MEQSTLDTALDTTNTAPAEPSPAFTEEVAPAASSDAAQESAAGENPNVYVPQPELSESLSVSESVAEGERREVENGREYEIAFITRAGDADATRQTTESARALIEDFGGAIDQVSATEVRRLAYPIKREIEGVYTFVNTRFAPEHLPEVDRFFKLEESVLRHMILRDEL